MAELKSLKKNVEKIAPFILMILAQVIASSYAVVSRVVFIGGTDPIVFNIYQFIASLLFMAPLAFFFERKTRPPFTFSIACWLFLHALLGGTLFQDLFSASLNYISSTSQSAIVNLFPAFTYVLSVVVRQEQAELNRLRGIGKLLGTVISVTGAFTLIFWKSNAVSSIFSSVSNAHIGFAMAVLGTLSLSSWVVLQRPVTERYPAELSLTAMLYLFSTFQTGIVAAFTSREALKWKLNWDLELLNILAGGILNGGAGMCIMTWCAKKKGPLFVAVFSPLNLLLTAVIEMVVVGNKMNAGSALGSTMIVGGLYVFLWSKSKEEIEKREEEEADDVLSPFLTENP